MVKAFYLGVLLGASVAAAQVASAPVPEPSRTPGIQGLTPDTELRGKTSLVRGVLKRLDPIHDELLVHAFGGGDLRIAFDPRTELIQENTRTQVTSIPPGSVISVDTVIDRGKLFARSVRLNAPTAGEVSGQVIRYDPGKSRLLLRDPASPEELALRVTSSTTVVKHDQHVSPDTLAPGMLVDVKFAAAQNTATNIEILAERGNTFTFAGKIVAVDLRTRLVSLSNTSDQTVRELAINSLDPTSLRLLREGAEVSVQAEFDGDRYIARAVTLVPQTR